MNIDTMIQPVSEQFSPLLITENTVRSAGRNVLSLSLVNHSCKDQCRGQLSRLRRIYELCVKYPQYNERYEEEQKNYDSKGAKAFREHFNIEFPGGNPQLLDALFSGCKYPIVRPTYNAFTKETESDIHEIVRLTPQSLSCTIGEMRCRDLITPLYAACINKNVPISVVEFFLKKGANIDATISHNGEPVPMIQDLKSAGLNENRLIELKKLFDQYAIEKKKW